MRAYDIILKKRNNQELSEEEIKFLIDNYVHDDVPDYQVSAFLTAIYFNGLTDQETYYLTKHIAQSGDIIDLSSIKGIKVDKHSTGGVGDKVTFIAGAIVASLGVPVAKMSGRGLGHTGGTIDKLESIPGISTSIDKEKFFDIVNKVGFSIIEQSGNLVPADKKLYALRDVTATVDQISLIASSIMSKKIASGADAILLDVKTGSGAFMKTLDNSIELAKKMINIGKLANKKVIALVTNMDEPLGHNIGNSLEIIEVAELLKTGKPEDLLNISIEVAANMLYLAEYGDLDKCKQDAFSSISNGSALKKLKEMIKAQGGNPNVLDDYSLFDQAKAKYDIISQKSGYVSKIDSERIGYSSVRLGAGRNKKEDQIDYSAGIILNKKVGDFINEGDKLATLYSSSIEKCKEVSPDVIDSFELSDKFEQKEKYVYARITESEVEIYN